MSYPVHWLSVAIYRYRGEKSAHNEFNLFDKFVIISNHFVSLLDLFRRFAWSWHFVTSSQHKRRSCEKDAKCSKISDTKHKAEENEECGKLNQKGNLSEISKLFWETFEDVVVFPFSSNKSSIICTPGPRFIFTARIILKLSKWYQPIIIMSDGLS